MELFQQILVSVLQKEKIEISFPNLNIALADIVQLECYLALQKIKTVIENDVLDDKDCFIKIEEIVCIFEQLGSGGKNRHDFG